MSDTKVPKGNKNCWTCPTCDQYNGFKTDGDYNTPIPSQFDENMNYGIGAIKNKQNYQNQNVYFCNLCLEKQTKKIELINKYRFINDCYNELDYLNYKKSLEEQFSLCFTCESRVNEQINLKNTEILPDYIEWSMKQKRRNGNRKENRKYSIVKQLNVLPVFSIITCFLTQIIVYSNPFLKMNNSILNVLIQHENKLNILSFSIVFISTKSGSLRPSITFSNLQLLLIISVILYDYWVDLEDNKDNNDNNRLMKSPILLVLIFQLVRFLWRFISLVKALSYSRSSFVLSSPKNEISGNEKPLPNQENRFISNKPVGNYYSEYSKNLSRNDDSSSKSLFSNVTFQSKHSLVLKPSKLNFVKSPQSILSLKDFSKSKTGTSICSRTSLGLNNFDSVSQCLSVGNRSVYSRKSSNTFISANSRLSHEKPKEISSERCWKVLLKYFFGALFGIGLNLILVLLLAHFNIEQYLYYK